MRSVGAVTIDTAILDKMVAEAKPKANAICERFAFAIQGEAQNLAPVDTGALKASLEAEQIEVLSWQVHDGVEYGVYQELGTSKMAAQPFLVPALEKFRQKFADAFKELFGERS